MATLERAIQLATEAHQGQVDKAGHPYILHPLRVMFRVKTVEERIVAVLHDTIEDTSLTAEDLQREGFSSRVIEAIQCLTKNPGESYEQFIDRIKDNVLASRVKRADIRDNMDLSRLPSVSEKDLTRMKKYHTALNRLINTRK